jgi:peptidoglycan/LPS O-acetylase OafA/YrhL
MDEERSDRLHKSEGTRSAQHFQPEIQGMRALSVLAVVWAHGRLPGLPGGFTGVDVFFVISGFLITRLLLAEMTRTGRIDLLAFWARRARRLLPNAFAALIGTVLLALFLFPGYSPGQLAREIMSAAIQLANFHFANDMIDYFQSENAASPVLHFWSLSVEEQFYMVWPPVLLGIGLYFGQNRGRAAIILLSLVWCASFAASFYITYDEQPFAYFSTWTRCWQLATGGLLAAGWQRVEQFPSRLRAAFAWLGLTAILVGIALLDEGFAYPGGWALLPTLGAAALIAGFGAASPACLLRRGLSAPVMQWIGERSYSWYLWHWPLLTLPRITYGDDVPYIELIAVPASFAIACAAYSWIETPIRKGKVFAVRPLPTLAAAGAGLAVVIAAGYLHMPALFLKDPEQANKVLLVEAASKDVPPHYKHKCHQRQKPKDQGQCLYGDTAAKRRIALFGDSHAAHWFAGLDPAAKQSGWALHVSTKAACPFADVVVLGKYSDPYTECREWREHNLAKLVGSSRPDIVILSNYLSIYYQRLVDPASGRRLTPEQARETLKSGARKTIERLLAAGIDVVLIRDTPQANRNYQRCFIVNKSGCARPRKQALPPADVEDMVAQEFAGRVKLFDFTDAICSGAECPITKDGVIVYRDSHHLTASFSTSLAPHMLRMLESFTQKPENGSVSHPNPDLGPNGPLTSALGLGEITAPK